MFPYTLTLGLVLFGFGLYFMQKRGAVADYLRFVAVVLFLASITVFGNCSGTSCDRAQTIYSVDVSREDMAPTNMSMRSPNSLVWNLTRPYPVNITYTYALNSYTYTVSSIVFDGWRAVNATLAVYAVGSLLYTRMRKIEGT